MLTFRDCVKESVSPSPGFGTLTLTGAIVGYQSATTAGLDGKSSSWRCEAVDGGGVPTGQWEVFEGVFTASGTTLTRARVVDSSNGPTNRVNFSGACNVFSVMDAGWAAKLGAINNFGDAGDGDLNFSDGLTHNLETTTAVDDTGIIIRQYRSFSLTGNSTLTANHRAQVMVILVQGDCTISAGSLLHMNARGAAAAASTISLYRALANLWGEALPGGMTGGLAVSIPQAGAVGGATQSTGTVSNGNNGANGVAGQTGGGGSGAGGNGTTIGNGGAGAAGTSFCGGSGGGAGGDSSTKNGSAGAANGGAGGNAGPSSASNCSIGGAGNSPGSSSGTGGTAPTGGGGGTLILVVGGNITLGGLIQAQGSSGGRANGGTSRNMGGGGAGGGSIIVLYGGSFSGSTSNIDASGGIAGAALGGSVSNNNGGAGGNGSVQGPTKIAT